MRDRVERAARAVVKLRDRASHGAYRAGYWVGVHLAVFVGAFVVGLAWLLVRVPGLGPLLRRGWARFVTRMLTQDARIPWPRPAARGYALKVLAIVWCGLWLTAGIADGDALTIVISTASIGFWLWVTWSTLHAPGVSLRTRRQFRRLRRQSWDGYDGYAGALRDRSRRDEQ